MTGRRRRDRGPRAVRALLVLGAAILSAGIGGVAGAQEAEAATAPPVEYPVAPLRMDCLGRSCGAFRIVDLDLLAGSEGQSRGGVRFALGERWILGARIEDGARTAEITGSRLRLLATERDDGSARATGAWRGHRWSLTADARRRTDLENGGWAVAGGVGYRTSPALQLRLDLERDLQAHPPVVFAPRPWGGGRFGVRWQPGTRFELEAGVGYTRLRAGLGERLERWSVDLRSEAQTRRIRLALTARLDDERGRFDRREVAAGLDIELLLRSHLLLSAGIDEEAELGVADVGRTYRGGVQFFGRRYRFPRLGGTGDAIESLTRRAWDLGYGVDRVYDIDGLRDLRERLRLAGEPALAEAVGVLHAAQVEDRIVGQLGISWEGTRRSDTGIRLDRLTGQIGVPWPVAWPWTREQERVEFLRLEFEYLDARYGLGTREIGRAVLIEARLHRELALRAAWRQVVRTPLELALGIETDDRLSLGLRYAYGR